MFTTKDKIKEQIIHLAKGDNVTYLISQNKMYKPVGLSVVMTYKFDVRGAEIIYNKWFVDGFEYASKMNLPGCEHHDQLVKGSSVMVLSKNHSCFNFYGQDAKDIITACEFGRDITSHMIANHSVIQY